MIVTPPLDEWQIREVLETVYDPEIPVLSVVDMGIVRRWVWDGARLLVSITPTYSGCPAMRTIEEEIVAAFRNRGIDASVTKEISPAWTTDWLSPEARARLRDSGITPPAAAPRHTTTDPVPQTVACPYCDSTETEEVSAFGSTPCKALFRCRSCGSPFDHFKRL